MVELEDLVGFTIKHDLTKMNLRYLSTSSNNQDDSRI